MRSVDVDDSGLKHASEQLQRTGRGSVAYRSRSALRNKKNADAAVAVAAPPLRRSAAHNSIQPIPSPIPSPPTAGFQYPTDAFRETHELMDSLIASYQAGCKDDTDAVREVQRLVSDVLAAAAEKDRQAQESIKGERGAEMDQGWGGGLMDGRVSRLFFGGGLRVLRRPPFSHTPPTLSPPLLSPTLIPSPADSGPRPFRL